MTVLHKSDMPDEWYHASRDPGVIDQFNPDKDPFAREREESAPKHWNAHLGTHFTSRHDTAANLGFDHGGRIYHANLDLQNPKHYESERDMDEEAYDHHITDAGEDFPAFPTPEDALTSHPRARELAHNFRDHLQSQGHDGVTYGNEYERPLGHLCAIAFHPHQIHVTEHHLHQEPCSRDRNDHCENCGANIDSPMCHECGHFTMLSSKTASEDYRMQHTAPGPDDAPLHDLTSESAGVYPDDVYTHPHYYAYEPSDHRSMNIAHRVKGKPDAKVRIYRALPPERAHEGIHPGDWVSIDRGYARDHAKHPTDPKQDWPVISASVPAKHVHTAGDSISEWGYNGPETVGATGKPLYTGPTKDFSFSGGGTGPRDSGQTRVNAWDPEGNYAGHVLAEHGNVIEHHVEPQHAETDLADRLLKAHDKMPKDQQWGNVVMKHAADEQGLPNPYHSGDDFHHTWFHGSTTPYDKERSVGTNPLDSPSHYRDEDMAGSGHGGPQMNKLLGTHFSAIRSVAKGFAKDYADSDVYHARLKMKNPAYFPTEHHLARHVFRHIMENHPEFANDEKFNSEQRWQGGSTPRQLAERDRQVGDDDSHPRRSSLDQAMDSIMSWHPKQREFAKSFTDSLRAQGHDGIVYGNLVEGPKFHHSAIALHPDDIDVQHIAHLPESPKGGDPENPWRRTESPERTADHALDESPDRLGDIQEQHHGSRERFDFEHSSRTNQDHGPWTPYSGKHILTPYSAARKPVRRDPRTGIEMCHKTVGGYRDACRFLLGHTQQCDIDWDTVYPDEPDEPTKKEGSVDYEQMPLHPDMPTGMPDMGTTKGNPQLPIYRALAVEHNDPEFDEHIDNHLGESHQVDQKIAERLMSHVTAPKTDRGVSTNVGLHWTHDKDWAEDYAHDYHREHTEGVGTHRPVIVEAHHPGLEHAMSWDNPQDHKALEKTVGPQQYDSAMLGEVPIRPGAPLHIRALHVVDAKGDFHRIPFSMHHQAGLLGGLPEGLDFRYRTLPGKHVIEAHIPHPTDPGERKSIGHLSLDGGFDDEHHPVSGVQVHPDYRRHGVGQALWSAAQGMGFRPQHTPEVQTEDGAAWASHVAAISDSQQADFADHFEQFHPHLDAASPMADWLHRAEHHQKGQRTMGPRRGEPLDSHPHQDSIDPYVPSWSRTAGANGPDYEGLTFDDLDSPGWPHTHGHRLLRAHHPDHGMVGALYYDNKKNNLSIGRLSVPPEHQRRGVATAMMRELESRYPGRPIDHGMRSDQGHAWAESMYGTPVPENLREKQNWTINGKEAAVRNVSDNGYSIHVRKEPTTQWGLPALHVTTQYEGKTVGGLSVHQRHGEGGVVEVPNVWVDEEHQRRGLATAMYDEVGRHWPDVPIQHSEHASGAAKALNRTLQAVTGAVRTVSDSKSDGDGITEGIMVAIVPPEDLAQRLQVEDGEDPAQIHLTLAYLGQTGEYSGQQLADLKEAVAAWAEAHEPLSATVQGSGTFVKAQEDGQHVLWASVDAPGLERLHVSLVDYLLERGYHPSMNHVFVPHMTLSYEKYHVRFLPKVERETWPVQEVWVCIAGRWESVTLGAEDDHDHTAARGKPRRDQSRPGGGDPAPDGQQGDPGAVGDGQGAPRPLSLHPKVEKEMARMHPRDQRMLRDTMDRLSQGDPTLETHALTLSLKGWYATKASRGHRIVHQPDGNGGIFVGYAGLHDYDKAINRLTSALEKIFAVRV